MPLPLCSRVLLVRRPVLRATRALTCVGFLLALAAPARAQGGFGFQGGGTLDPDQGYFGMHYISQPLRGDLRVHPAADVGFGNDVVLSSIHVDFAQWFTMSPKWQLYFGGGPSVNIYRFDEGVFGDGAERDVQGGFDTVVGVANDSGVTFELRVGANGSPNLRFGVGYTFKR